MVGMYMVGMWLSQDMYLLGGGGGAGATQKKGGGGSNNKKDKGHLAIFPAA